MLRCLADSCVDISSLQNSALSFIAIPANCGTPQFFHTKWLPLENIINM